MDSQNPISKVKNAIIRYFANIEYDFIILFIIICPILAYFLIRIREPIDESKRTKLLNMTIGSAFIAFTLFFVTFGSLSYIRHSIISTRINTTVEYTTEAPTTTRRRSTTTPRQTTTTTESSTTTGETTSSPDTSTEAADSTAETTTESTTQTSAETTTATTRATTAPPTEPVYTEPPAIQTQTQVVYKDYFYNSNSGIFHSSGCRTIPDNMGDHWIAYYSTTSDYMRSLGYKPCGTCKP